jgi:sugar-specific transcriptional regulator TrmB
MKEEVKKILSKIGLTGQESKVYLALLTLEEAQTGVLCKKTGIASSNIYNILDGLQEKGLISYRMQNNIKVYMSSDPEVLNELFIEKQKKFEQERKEIKQLVKQLRIKRVQEKPQSNYKYYEGVSGIKGMWHEINSSLTGNSVERIYGTKKRAVERLIGFYDEHHKIRNRLKAKARILLSAEMKDLARKRENKNTKVKLTKLNNEAEWGVVDDMFYIQYIVTKNPRAFLIKDKIFAKTFKEVFDKVWEDSQGYCAR